MNDCSQPTTQCTSDLPISFDRLGSSRRFDSPWVDKTTLPAVSWSSRMGSLCPVVNLIHRRLKATGVLVTWPRLGSLRTEFTKRHEAAGVLTGFTKLKASGVLNLLAETDFLAFTPPVGSSNWSARFAASPAYEKV